MSNDSETFLEREHVPHNKEFHASTRQNSEYKWHAKHVVGALEIDSDLNLNLRGVMKPHVANDFTADKFDEAQKVFEELNLRDSFIEAAEGFPVETSCCGLIADDARTIRKLVPHLNKTWVVEANKLLHPKGFKVDCYVWHWSHISGQSESYLLLIRFHVLTSSAT